MYATATFGKLQAQWKQTEKSTYLMIYIKCEEYLSPEMKSRLVLSNGWRDREWEVTDNGYGLFLWWWKYSGIR